MTGTEINLEWPQQLRLPGQTAAHPGPIDMTMMYLMHHAFRRDLAAFAAAAKVTPVADREAWAASPRAGSCSPGRSTITTPARTTACGRC